MVSEADAFLWPLRLDRDGTGVTAVLPGIALLRRCRHRPELARRLEQLGLFITWLRHAETHRDVGDARDDLRSVVDRWRSPTG